MSKKKKISAKEKHRRLNQSRDQWEKDNPVTAHLLDKLYSTINNQNHHRFLFF